MQQNKQIQNSLTVEVTAYIELAVNGTWKVVGFEPDTLAEISDKVPDTKQTTWDDVRDKLIRKGEIDGDAYPTTQDLLDNAKKVRKQRKKDWSNTVRKVQQCSYCEYHNLNAGWGANIRTCNRDGTHRAAIPRPKGW